MNPGEAIILKLLPKNCRQRLCRIGGKGQIVHIHGGIGINNSKTTYTGCCIQINDAKIISSSVEIGGRILIGDNIDFCGIVRCRYGCSRKNNVNHQYHSTNKRENSSEYIFLLASHKILLPYFYSNKY